MKAIFFLLILSAVVGFLVWRMRKSQAEAASERRRALERRKKKDSEALSQDTEVIWPVIVTTVTGKRPPGDATTVEEPTMTSIEYEPVESKSLRQGGAS